MFGRLPWLRTSGGVDRGHVAAGGGVMGFVDDDGEPPVVERAGELVHVEELLDGRDDDLRLAREGIGEVGARAGVVHDLHESGRALEALDRSLELAVDHLAVGRHDDGVEDLRPVLAVERREPVRHP